MNEQSFIRLSKETPVGWHITVQQDIPDTTPEAITEAKESALTIARELEAELNPFAGVRF
jgi:hypothetical protein